MKQLDRTKPFGEVYGDTEGKVYCQDGVYFDCNGLEHGKAPKELRKPLPLRSAKTRQDEEDQVLRQLSE